MRCWGCGRRLSPEEQRCPTCDTPQRLPRRGRWPPPAAVVSKDEDEDEDEEEVTRWIADRSRRRRV